jgi:2-C-methyl-D-erythritol 4-phosphate cytidylyltransferase/2-C-methyl-D-erythritol 2,4-cyclodiphosphate synthase
MINLTLILLSAGESSRFNMPVKKQWLRVNRTPLWLYVLNKFQNMFDFSKIIITANKDEVELYKHFADVKIKIVAGGNSRQESIKKALKHTKADYVLISDVARACVPKSLIKRVISNYYQGDVIVPYLKTSDTVVLNDKTVDRNSIKLIQTPQLSKRVNLQKLLNNSNNQDYTDESTLFAENGYKRFFVKGDKRAEKLTFSNDSLDCLKKASNKIVVGNGFDIHQLEISDSPLMLGGIEINSNLSLKAYSDGDVLIHSLIDALLGSAGLGDIGEFFPDTDKKYKGIDSTILLNKVVEILQKIGMVIDYVDITIIAEKPKLQTYKSLIKRNLSKFLNIEFNSVNIKATTTEKLGFIGRGEGIGVFTTATLSYFNWSKYQ